MSPNEIRFPSEEDRAMLVPALDGPCYEFAVALHQNTGWPMVGLIINATIRHAGVRRPDGLIHDVRGPIPEDVFIAPFLESEREHIIRIITTEELLATRGLVTVLLRRFSLTIPILWPDLPIPENHFMMRVTAFTEDLRKISEKYGICVREQCPGAPIHFAPAEGDEQYILSPTTDGIGWTLRRNIIV